MRAKEYLAFYGETVKYIDDIKRIVNDLYPLRRSKAETNKYYREILSADERCSQNESANNFINALNNTHKLKKLIPKSELEHYPNEIPKEISKRVRLELFKVICQDKSFGYMNYLLATDRNSYLGSKYYNWPEPQEGNIIAAIRYNCEDYPKDSLDAYLDDNFNYEQFRILKEKGFDDGVLLEFYNSTYALYDSLRCVMHKVSEVRKICNNYVFASDKEKYYKISFIIKLIETFGPNEERLNRCKTELQDFIEPIKKQYEPISTPSRAIGKINLSEKKGTTIDFIRVINVLFEMGFFTDAQGEKCTKKMVFQAFGECINKDISDYQMRLSSAKSVSNGDMKSFLKIFEEMLDKQKQINAKEQ